MDVSDIFYFFRSGEVKEESEATGRGEGRIFIENPKKGGLPGGGGGRRAWRVFVGNWGGGELNIFLSGPKCPPRIHQVYTLSILS